MLPDLAIVYLAGADSKALDSGFWHEVYGFNMQPMAAHILRESQGKAIVTAVPAEAIVTEVIPIRAFDLSTMRPEDADFSADFNAAFRDQVSPCIISDNRLLWKMQNAQVLLLSAFATFVSFLSK